MNRMRTIVSTLGLLALMSLSVILVAPAAQAEPASSATAVHAAARSITAFPAPVAASPSDRDAAFHPESSPCADEDCGRCYGTGHCWVCSGTGKGSSGENCSICNGSGKCWFCSGTGRHG